MTFILRCRKVGLFLDRNKKLLQKWLLGDHWFVVETIGKETRVKVVCMISPWFSMVLQGTLSPKIMLQCKIYLNERKWSYWRHSRWWFPYIFYFHPYLGKILRLTNIFQLASLLWLWEEGLDSAKCWDVSDPSPLDQWPCRVLGCPAGWYCW